MCHNTSVCQYDGSGTLKRLVYLDDKLEVGMQLTSLLLIIFSNIQFISWPKKRQKMMKTVLFCPATAPKPKDKQFTVT